MIQTQHTRKTRSMPPRGRPTNGILHVWMTAILVITCSIGPFFFFPTNCFASGNQPPVAVAGNITISSPGDSVFFHAHESHDPDGMIVLYEWDFQGDGIYDWNSTENGTTKFAYTKERAYNATLRVTDNASATATDIYFVIIYDEDDEESDPDNTILYLVGITEILFGASFIGLVWWWRRNLYSG